ncbi:uncharacterized protein RAG0_15454 [Rhynchosporium agropyri]|uniref:Uncharacterized protein n=1 Tax=Rhynchosporium agropyri TaxID=914238 RepID=A0A1E1LL93_9HELO|nr:uncharacterized protein RAG0_15454 [Rhynchosporium agropyri]
MCITIQSICLTSSQCFPWISFYNSNSILDAHGKASFVVVGPEETSLKKQFATVLDEQICISAISSPKSNPDPEHGIITMTSLDPIMFAPQM